LQPSPTRNPNIRKIYAKKRLKRGRAGSRVHRPTIQ
jgi:hypothetical protein